jgi:MDMPI C-terminal domain
MAHETAVHRCDAQLAGSQLQPVETKLAADGISEVLDTWLPAGRRRGPTDRQGVVHLMATDVAQEWYVRLRGAGLALLDTGTLLDSDDHHTRTLARGTASDLLLALYGRVPFGVLEIAGDAELLGALRTG